MNIGNNYNFTVGKLNFTHNLINEKRKSIIQEKSDNFSLNSNVEIKDQTVDKLFPNNSLEKVYNVMCAQLGLDYIPKLTFYPQQAQNMGGGYTFHTNSIGILYDNIDYKVVIEKNGKKQVLTSPKGHMPLLASKELIDKFVDGYKNLPIKMSVEKTTDEEKRKFLIQKIYHELVHAQQHMIMRQTEDIGTKEIIKAWTHLKPENKEDDIKLQEITEKQFQNSFWANKKPDNSKFSHGTDIDKQAHIWLEAVRCYPPVTSAEYTKNALESDAFMRSYLFVVNNFGQW